MSVNNFIYTFFPYWHLMCGMLNGIVELYFLLFGCTWGELLLKNSTDLQSVSIICKDATQHGASQRWKNHKENEFKGKKKKRERKAGTCTVMSIAGGPKNTSSVLSASKRSQPITRLLTGLEMRRFLPAADVWSRLLRVAITRFSAFRGGLEQTCQNKSAVQGRVTCCYLFELSGRICFAQHLLLDLKSSQHCGWFWNCIYFKCMPFLDSFSQ